eukprot:6987383-Heterocapsa_arctica.AAC.1
MKHKQRRRSNRPKLITKEPFKYKMNKLDTQTKIDRAEADKELTMNKERIELTCIESVKAEAGRINNKRRAEEEDNKEMGKAKNNKIEHD